MTSPKSLTERLRAAVAFDDERKTEFSETDELEVREFLRGEWNENARLQPIIDQLIECAKQLERACQVSAKFNGADLFSLNGLDGREAIATLEKLLAKGGV